jgi:hypothetical protein
VLMLLEDEGWSQWNDSEMGRRCTVEHKTVARLRPIICPKQADAPRTVSRGGGTVYSMKPRASGPKPAEPDQLPAIR